MRSARVPAVGLMAMLLLGTLTGATTERRHEPGPSTNDVRIVDQEASSVPVTGPATTAAFTAAPCPVAVPLPDLVEGEGYVCGLVTVPQRHADPGGTQLQLAVIRILSQAGCATGRPDRVRDRRPGGLRAGPGRLGAPC